MPKMTDASLLDLVKRRRDASVKHRDAHSAARQEALQFYRGDNLDLYGDSGDGLSTVVSRDLFESVESILPGLIKPFVSGDEAVRFEPKEADDEEGAAQATEYCNYKFANDNDAFGVVYDFAKDGLLFRLGVAKVVMEEVDESVIETLTGLDELQYAAADEMVRVDKALEIVDDPIGEEDGTITIRVKRQETRKTYRVHVMAPGEFLCEDRLASLEDATFLAHQKAGGIAVGDLIAMGLDKNKCLKLQGLDAETEEADDRHGLDAFREQFDDKDLARRVSVTDCYVRCDYDGTNVLGWRRVILAGTDDTVLLNEPAEDHPFVTWCPIPIPHKLIGYSIHDATRDIQINKTALIRELNNASYLANRPMREVVDGQVNIEDLLNPRVGGIVRVKAPGQIREIPSGDDGIMQQSAALIEYYDTIREQRTGSTRYNQGMDANSLNKTATGISIIQNASTQRAEIIARQLAVAMMRIFKKMLALVSRHADKKEFIRLRGEFVEVDPREWKTGYDMSVSVGLGTGNKEQMAAHLTNLLGVQKEIAEAQGGFDGPIVRWDHIYEASKRLTENLGLKGVERYFDDPSKQEEGEQEVEPAVDPMAEAQAAASLEIEKARIMADAKVEVGRIHAEAEIVIAGIRAGFNPEPQEYAPQGNAGLEGEDYAPEPVFAPDGPFPDELGPIPAELAGDTA